MLPHLEELHIEEIKMEEVAVIFEEKFKEILVETNLVEEFQTKELNRRKYYRGRIF